MTFIQQKTDKNKIRLLHLVQGLGMGGAEVLLFQHIRALGIQKYDHYVYYFSADGPVREKIETLGVPVHAGKRMASIKQPIRFIICLLSLVRDLMRFIKGNHIQFIQSHLGHANRLAVAVGKLSGVPTFPTVHSTMSFVDRRTKWDLRVYILKAVDAVIYRFADQILAVSQEIKEIVLQEFRLKDSKVMVLKNGILLEDSVSKSENLEREFPHSENKLKIIAVGRLVPLKGFDILVKATAEVLKQDLKDFLILIVGDGEERARLEKLIREMEIENYIKLLGIRHDVIGLMKASDIFAIPSRYEGLSIAMIEAMACDLPIIASDAPGLKTYIVHGKNGLLFPVDNHKAMAKCILRLIEDRDMRIRLSHGARESFEKEFDMQKNIKPLDLLFQEYVTIRQSFNCSELI